MKTACIISTGDELLSGAVINTSAAMLAKKLNLIGFDVKCVLMVADVKEQIVLCIKKLINQYDLLITTGGLGPTLDDLTMESVANALGKNLVEDKKTKEDIEEYFAKTHRHMTDNQFKQALIVSGGEVCHNCRGTAAGVYVKHENCSIAVLPGPPSECISMFEESVLPLLKRDFSAEKMLAKNFNVFGVGEGKLEYDVREQNLCDDVNFATYARDKEIRCVLKSYTNNAENVAIAYNKVLKVIGKYNENLKVTGEYATRKVLIYENDNIFHETISKLKEKKLSISALESCSGGLFISNLISVEGASSVIEGSAITYSIEQKVKFGVDKSVIDEFGVVSSETALSMAKAAKTYFNSDIGVGITGYASEISGIEESKNHLIFVAVYIDENNQNFLSLPISNIDNRDFHRFRASAEACALVRRMIN